MFGFLGERLIVGLEDDEDGSLRVYVDMRSPGIHTHVDDPEAKEQLRNDWGRFGHLFSAIPDSALCDCTSGATVNDWIS